MNPAVRVVILNFNGGGLVERSVEAALALDWPADRLEVVVVDNGSSDGSADVIAARFPDVRIIRNGRNSGFPANNLAMGDLDRVDHVALVNPDAFVEPDWLQHLVAAAESDPGLGAVCGRMLFADRFVDVEICTPTFRAPGDSRDLGVRVSGIRIDGVDVVAGTDTGCGGWPLEKGPTDEPSFAWTSGHAVLAAPVGLDDPSPPTVDVRLAVPTPVTATVNGVDCDVTSRPTWFTVPCAPPHDVIQNAGSVLVEGGFGADRGAGEPDGPAFDESVEVFAWCGGGVLLRADYLADVGLFDERMFLYYEDTDLSWRGRAAGWRYRYVPEARLRHVHAATTVVGSAVFDHYVERNRLIMLTKCAPWSVVGRAVLAHWRANVGYSRDQIVRPLLRRRRPLLRTVGRRIKSFVSYLVTLPGLLADRRAIRRRQVVPDADLLAWAVPQPVRHPPS